MYLLSDIFSKLFWEKSPFCVIQNYFQETDTKYQNIINPASCPSNITAFFSTTFFTLLSLSEKCPYSKFFWSVFSRIPTEYGKILRISPYSVRVLESTDQKNSKYGHFSRGVYKYEVYFSPNPFYPFKRQLTKWSNTLKQFIGKNRRIIWVSDNSVGLALQGLSQYSISISRFQGIEMEH